MDISINDTGNMACGVASCALDGGHAIAVLGRGRATAALRHGLGTGSGTAAKVVA